MARMLILTIIFRQLKKHLLKL